MDGVCPSEAKVWLALAAARGGWLKQGEVACAAGVAPQTAYKYLTSLVAAGLARRLRCGLPCYYQLADGAPGAAEHARRVEATARLLGLPREPCKGWRAA